MKWTRHRLLGKENPIVKTKLVLALLFVLLLGSSASLLARGFSGNCSGTYLMAEAGGATSLWTLEADGSARSHDRYRRSHRHRHRHRPPREGERAGRPNENKYCRRERRWRHDELNHAVQRSDHSITYRHSETTVKGEKL
jgi:hypothetical protein